MVALGTAESFTVQVISFKVINQGRSRTATTQNGSVIALRTSLVPLISGMSRVIPQVIGRDKILLPTLESSVAKPSPTTGQIWPRLL